jgi:peptide/nickel transport system ATP-binding protein
MLQRVMISMALSCEPQILIADEPTTALDVTIQAQILNLMDNLRSQMNTSILLITHDLGVIAEMCDRVMVMYAGKVVENGSVREVINNPLHPYTSALMKAIPENTRRGAVLETIEGVVPDLISRTEGCAFHPRCQYRMDKCEELSPSLGEKQEGHFVACYR